MRISDWSSDVCSSDLTMILGLCESPLTFNAIIEWSNALNNGDMQLREILDLEAMLTKDPAPESLEDEEEDDGEISEKNAGVSFKDEEDRKSTRLNSSH